MPCDLPQALCTQHGQSGLLSLSLMVWDPVFLRKQSFHNCTLCEVTFGPQSPHWDSSPTSHTSGTLAEPWNVPQGPIFIRKGGQHRVSSASLVAMTSDYLYEFPNRGSISGLLRPPGLIYWNQEDLGTGKLQPSSDQLRRSPWPPCFATTARAQLKSRHWALEWHRQHLIFPEGVCHCPVTTIHFIQCLTLRNSKQVFTKLL